MTYILKCNCIKKERRQILRQGNRTKRIKSYYLDILYIETKDYGTHKKETYEIF